MLAPLEKAEQTTGFLSAFSVVEIVPRFKTHPSRLPFEFRALYAHKGSKIEAKGTHALKVGHLWGLLKSEVSTTIVYKTPSLRDSKGRRGRHATTQVVSTASIVSARSTTIGMGADVVRRGRSGDTLQGAPSSLWFLTSHAPVWVQETGRSHSSVRTDQSPVGKKTELPSPRPCG